MVKILVFWYCDSHGKFNTTFCGDLSIFETPKVGFSAVMLQELHPTYRLIFVSIVHTCLTIFQARHSRATIVFLHFMQLYFMPWKLSEAKVSRFPLFHDLKSKPCKNTMSRKKNIPSKIFISDTLEEQSVIHQYM